jgi:hypothetical protein
MERTYVDDTTVEALVLVLRDNPRGVVVIKDELTGWIKAMDQYKAGGKGADRQFYLSGWSRKSYVNDRKGAQGTLRQDATGSSREADEGDGGSG